MTAFAETYVYRDLYMMVEAWEDEGGRLDVLDSLRRVSISFLSSMPSLLVFC